MLDGSARRLGGRAGGGARALGDPLAACANGRREARWTRSSPHAALLCALAVTWLVLGSEWAWPARWRPGERAAPRGAVARQVLRGVGVAESRIHDRAAALHVARANGSAAGLAASAARPTPAGLPGATGAPTPVRSLDPRPQRILLFGDSMVPTLAPRLGDYSHANHHELYAAVWYGSTIIFWAWQDKLDQLLAETHPTLVIAALGSSELTVRDVGECEPYVRMIERKVAPRPLLWVGPPNWRDDTGVNALLERLLGPERFFRSERLRLERTADGIHPTAAAGAGWVDALAGWIEHDSRWPIALHRPRGRGPKVPLRVFSPPTEWRK